MLIIFHAVKEHDVVRFLENGIVGNARHKKKGHDKEGKACKEGPHGFFRIAGREASRHGCQKKGKPHKKDRRLKTDAKAKIKGIEDF